MSYGDHWSEPARCGRCGQERGTHDDGACRPILSLRNMERGKDWAECRCGKLVSLLPRGQYEYFCACGQRFNSVGQAIRAYCCPIDEQGFDCGHGETE